MGLLCHGANVNIADQDGNTPLHLAVQNNLVSIIHALIVFEAEVDYMCIHLNFRYLDILVFTNCINNTCLVTIKACLQGT